MFHLCAWIVIDSVNCPIVESPCLYVTHNLASLILLPNQTSS